MGWIDPVAAVGNNVSHLARRGNLPLFTIGKIIEAMVSNLSLVAVLPDRDPVVLSGITGGQKNT